jgi:hypothetical protein
MRTKAIFGAHAKDGGKGLDYSPGDELHAGPLRKSSKVIGEM